MDIDKANVLGLKFNHGELITWSNFYDLSTRENSEISENLPFPTGRRVLTSDMITRAFEVNERNYEILTDEDSDQQIVVRDSKGNVLSAVKNTNGVWDIAGEFSYTNIRAIINRIPQGDTVNYADNLALGIKDGINTKEYDFAEDFKEYLNSLETI